MLLKFCSWICSTKHIETPAKDSILPCFLWFCFGVFVALISDWFSLFCLFVLIFIISRAEYRFAFLLTQNRVYNVKKQLFCLLSLRNKPIPNLNIPPNPSLPPLPFPQYRSVIPNDRLWVLHRLALSLGLGPVTPLCQWVPDVTDSAWRLRFVNSWMGRLLWMKSRNAAVWIVMKPIRIMFRSYCWECPQYWCISLGHVVIFDADKWVR